MCVRLFILMVWCLACRIREFVMFLILVVEQVWRVPRGFPDVSVIFRPLRHLRQAAPFLFLGFFC